MNKEKIQQLEEWRERVQSLLYDIQERKNIDWECIGTIFGSLYDAQIQLGKEILKEDPLYFGGKIEFTERYED